MSNDDLPKAAKLPAPPIDVMSALEYQIFAQQAAMEAFDMGMVKLTPNNSAPLSKSEDQSGEWGAE